jgi:DNA-binding NtrC family response regulator
MLSDRLEALVADMIDRGVLFEDAAREFEKRFIAQILRRSDGSLTKAASTLGIHRNSLSRKLARHKLKKRG